MWGMGHRRSREQRWPHLCLLPSPLPGLKPPQDLEAKEVTPRTALLTWREPEVPPTGYLLSFDTHGGQIQVPTAVPLTVCSPELDLAGPPLALSGRLHPLLTCPLSVCVQEILLPAGTTSHRLLRLYPSTFYSAQLRAVWDQSLTPPVSTSFTTGTGSAGWAEAGGWGVRFGGEARLPASSLQVDCGSPFPGTVGRSCRMGPAPRRPPPSSSTATESGLWMCFVTWRPMEAAGWWVPLGARGFVWHRGRCPGARG